MSLLAAADVNAAEFHSLNKQSTKKTKCQNEKKTDLRPTYKGGVVYYKLVKAVWDHGGWSSCCLWMDSKGFKRVHYATPKICVNDWTAGRVEEQQKTWFTARPWLVLIMNWTNPCMPCGAAGIYSSQSNTSDCEQNAKLFDLLWKLEKYYFWSCYINFRWSCRSETFQHL